MISVKDMSPSAASYVMNRAVEAMKYEASAFSRLIENPFIKLAEAAPYQGVSKIVVKRLEDWSELNLLWLRSGMLFQSRKIMWNGTPIVAAWDPLANLEPN